MAKPLPQKQHDLHFITKPKIFIKHPNTAVTISGNGGNDF